MSARLRRFKMGLLVSLCRALGRVIKIFRLMWQQGLAGWKSRWQLVRVILISLLMSLFLR